MAQYYGYETIPRDGLVAEYLLDGNANDTAGSNNGTATNVTWVGANRGYAKDCGSFNGDAGIGSNGILSNTDMTFSFWFIKFTNDLDSRLLYQYNTSGFYIGIFIDGKINFPVWFNGNLTHLISETILEINKYYHIVARIKNGKMNLYFNTIKDSNTLTGTGNISNGGIFYIGRDLANNRNFNGNIGLVRIYNKALSQKEINNLYLEGLRKFGPSIIQQNNGAFSKYTPLSLPKPVLHIDGTHNLNTYYDQSGNGNHGTQHGGVTVSNLGLNKVMNFDGVNDRIDTGLTDNYSAFTISAIFSITDNGFNDMICKWNDTGNQRGLIIRIHQGKINFIISSNGSSVTSDFISNNTFNDGKKYLINIVNYGNGGNLPDIYINGIKQLGSYTGTAETPFNTNQNFTIGYLFNTASTYFNGTISDIKVFNQTLTPQQIQALYYSNKIT